jgi:hypothetical protein
MSLKTENISIKSSLKFCFLIVFFLFSFCAESSELGGRKYALDIRVTDNATGGCWTNVASVARRAETLFRQEGVKARLAERVTTFLGENEVELWRNTDSNYILYINLVANRLSGQCWGVADIVLNRLMWIDEYSSRQPIRLQSIRMQGVSPSWNAKLIDFVNQTVPYFADHIR